MASVIKKNGMLATKQNIVIGWGVPAFIILFNMCFEYENYGGTYHCWLQMDKGESSPIKVTFGSDRSSRNANLRPSVCPKLAIREQSDCVIQSEPKILHLVLNA